MPTYDYLCEACGHQLEVFQRFSETDLEHCPACRKPKLRRQLGGGGAIIFKGSGFYETDYRSESYKSAAKKEAGAGKDKSGDSDKSSGTDKSPDAGKSAPAATKKSPTSKGGNDSGKTSE